MVRGSFEDGDKRLLRMETTVTDLPKIALKSLFIRRKCVVARLKSCCFNHPSL